MLKQSRKAPRECGAPSHHLLFAAALELGGLGGAGEGDDVADVAYLCNRIMDEKEVYNRLCKQLADEGALWSYAPQKTVTDEVLTEMVYLDLPQIDDLFCLYP